MNKENLLKSAKELKKVSDKTYQEYFDKIDNLVNIMNDQMLKRPDINELVGEKNIAMMKDNHSNHARFISSILKNFSAEILVDTVLWVFRAYRSRNFHSNYWAAQLNTWILTLKKELSNQSFAEVYPYYEWMQVNIPIFVKISDTDLEAGQSMH